MSNEDPAAWAAEEGELMKMTKAKPRESGNRRSGVKPLRGKQSWPCPTCDDRHTEQIYTSPSLHLCTACGNGVVKPHVQSETQKPADPAAWAHQQAKDALPCEFHETVCKLNHHGVKCPAFNRPRMVAALIAAEQRGAERAAEQIRQAIPLIMSDGGFTKGVNVLCKMVGWSYPAADAEATVRPQDLREAVRGRGTE